MTTITYILVNSLPVSLIIQYDDKVQSTNIDSDPILNSFLPTHQGS